MKRIILRIVLAFAILFVVVAVVAAVIIVPQARPLLVKQLSDTLQCPVSIGAIVWLPPSGVRVRAFEAQSPAGRAQPPWLKAEAVDVQVALWSLLLRRTLVVDIDVHRPALTVEQLADGRLSLPTFAAPAPAPAPATPSGAAPSQAPAVLPHRVRLLRGVVIYRDQRQTPPWTLTLAPVTLDVAAQPQGVRYRGDSGIRGSDDAPVGTLEFEGTTAFDGQTTATVQLAHRALPQLAPYLRPVLGAAPTAGALAVRAAITGRPEAMTARVHVEMTGLVLPPEAMTAAGVTAAQLLPLLQDEQGRVVLDFTIAGRWDQLQVGWNELAASAVQQILRQLVTQRLPNILLRGLTQALEPSGAGAAENPLDSLKALGRSLEQTLKDQLLPSSAEPPPSPEAANQDAQSSQ